MPVLEKRLGSLPVIAEFSRRLDIAGVIDRACPIRDVAHAIALGGDTWTASAREAVDHFDTSK